MSDLISRSALLKEFETANEAHVTDLWHITGIKAFVDNQPTAYDVEKVLAELENKSYLEGSVSICKDAVIDLVTAIDIVERGGIE